MSPDTNWIFANRRGKRLLPALNPRETQVVGLDIRNPVESPNLTAHEAITVAIVGKSIEASKLAYWMTFFLISAQSPEAID